MACHCSAAEAAVTGVCEVIERDALMITWQAMIAPPQISAETLSDANRDLVTRFERAASRVTLFDITVDVGVHSVLAVLRSDTDELPAVVFAASTSLNPEEAVRKSLEELAHTRRYCHAIKSWVPRIVPNPPNHENIVDQITHLNFWSDAANAILANFIFQLPKRVDFQEMENLSTGDPGLDLQRLCERVCAQNQTAHKTINARQLGE